MNYDEAQFEAALMRFARDPGDPVEIVQYLRWLWEKQHELDARMTAIESDLGDLPGETTRPSQTLCRSPSAVCRPCGRG